MEKIEKMDRATCKRIEESVKQDIINKAKELGLEAHIGGGSFDSETFTMKIRFQIPVKAVSHIGNLTQVQVNCGLAPRGTKVKIGEDTAVIERTKRTKYVIKLDSKSDKLYTVKFGACVLI